jgi:hypothetical protein
MTARPYHADIATLLAMAIRSDDHLTGEEPRGFADGAQDEIERLDAEIEDLRALLFQARGDLARATTIAEAGLALLDTLTDRKADRWDQMHAASDLGAALRDAGHAL